jgi:hypothetical protein
VANRAERRRQARLASSGYRPSEGLDYNEFVGELRPPNKRAFTELHVRYGVRNGLYVDWTITLQARLGDIEEFRNSGEPLERRKLVVVDVSASAIRRHVYQPYEPDEPPETTVLVDLKVGDEAKVDREYQIQMNGLAASWAEKHGASSQNPHTAAAIGFVAKNRGPEMQHGALSWVRNTLICTETDIADAVLSERGGYYFPATPFTVGVFRSTGRMQFIQADPKGKLKPEEGQEDPEYSHGGTASATGDISMGKLVDAIYTADGTEDLLADIPKDHQDAGPKPGWSSWPAPWDGVSAKLAHAWRHFLLLAQNTTAFVQQHPVRTEIIAAPERGPNWLKCELHVTHPDTSISLMFGDFLHNLRCALDHSLTAIDPRAGRRANFPASLTEADFDNKWAAEWTDAGGSGGSLAAIRENQPFHGTALGVDPENFVLRIVARLNNADKHRLLNLTPIGLSDEKPAELTATSTAEIVSHEYLLKHGYPLEAQQTALLIELDRPANGAQVEIEGTIPIAVSIEHYFDLIELGHRLHKSVVEMCHCLRQGSLAGWPDPTT